MPSAFGLPTCSPPDGQPLPLLFAPGFFLYLIRKRETAEARIWVAEVERPGKDQDKVSRAGCVPTPIPGSGMNAASQLNQIWQQFRKAVYIAVKSMGYETHVYLFITKGNILTL